MKIYHYCSSDAFLAIMKNKTIRLSSLTQSNDTMEGKWLSSIIIEIARDKKIASDNLARLRDEFESIYSFIDMLGFCLSEKPDSLSQWRGYADDGRGFSIGFDVDLLRKAIDVKDANTIISLQKVIYDESQQKMRAETFYNNLNKSISEGALSPLFYGLLANEQDKSNMKNAREKSYTEFLNTIISILPELFLFKNPAFSEESEWRLISGYSKIKASKVEFRTRGSKIIPYIDLNFSDNIGVVGDIYIGPKNETQEDILRHAISNFGFSEMKVTRSTATYR